MTWQLISWSELRSAAHIQTNGRQTLKGSPCFHMPRLQVCATNVQRSRLTSSPLSGKHSSSQQLILADKQSRTSGHLLKRDRRGAMNGACLVQQCQTMAVNGVANRAPVRGAASSFPTPSPPPFKGLCSRFKKVLDPKPSQTGGQSQWVLCFRREGHLLAVPMTIRCLHCTSLPRLPALCAIRKGDKDKTKANIQMQAPLFHLGEGKSISITLGWATGLWFRPFWRARQVHH